MTEPRESRPAVVRAWRAPAIEEPKRSAIGDVIHAAAIAAVETDDPPADTRIADASARPRLAYVSPLAPERTGISDYSGELLPYLARHYDIDVVVAQPQVQDEWVRAHCQVRTVEWFEQHGASYDRVLYHFGNSRYHQHMFRLLERHPGAVVLHDFYLGHLLSGMEHDGPYTHAWSDALYRSHGYAALARGLHPASRAEAIWEFPCNLPVLLGARGVIVHSRFSANLAREWYGPQLSESWALVPHLRIPVPEDPDARARARAALGIADDEFVVCSFGVIGSLKLSHELVEAWARSGLARRRECSLVFVGQNERGRYGRQLARRTRDRDVGRVRITGWADNEIYRHYLAAADVAVQLRVRSRGETSGAVLDCLNHGVPTIVNAHGAMADLPAQAVHRIAGALDIAELARALDKLWSDTTYRQAMRASSRAYLLRHHEPSACAQAYADAIERFHVRPRTMAVDVARRVAALGPLTPDEAIEVARAIDYSLPRPRETRQLLVDVSAICRTDLKTGIQRVVRSVLKGLVASPPAGWRIEPVYLTDAGGRWHLRYARRYMLGLLGCPADTLDDDVVEPDAGDVFLGLDLAGGFVLAADRAELLSGWKAKGVSINFVVYDLLPAVMPDKFPQAEYEPFCAWLDVVARADGVFCISNAVAQEFAAWRARVHGARPGPWVGHFHLGADIQQSAPTHGKPESHEAVTAALQARPTFLMVGTLEPRKGGAQVIAALEALWARGIDCNLAIVGKQGWQVDALAASIRDHAESGRRLFWLQGISDEFLDHVYRASTCLVAASEGEGFGLPLIEAAQHGIPIVARDIPVFREVAGNHAFYFTGMEGANLAAALEDWLDLHRQGRHPPSAGMDWLTWQESTEQLKRLLARSGALGDTPQT
jgi:glycosyltransferase involved in cell wall biosynthesis